MRLPSSSLPIRSSESISGLLSLGSHWIMWFYCLSFRKNHCLEVSSRWCSSTKAYVPLTSSFPRNMWTQALYLMISFFSSTLPSYSVCHLEQTSRRVDWIRSIWVNRTAHIFLVNHHNEGTHWQNHSILIVFEFTLDPIQFTWSSVLTIFCE